jgi:glucose/arabinose dehydrogenase
VLSPYVAGFDLPLDLAVMPDGGLLVAEKGSGVGTLGLASVRLVRNGSLQALPVITISTNTNVDAGINGLALHPDFAANGWFFLWHATGQASTGWTGTSVNRLTRYTFDPLTETADPASELILIDGLALGSSHNGGGLAFDPAGNLYIATGDAFLYTPSQDLQSLSGKLLRITPTAAGYTIPPDNPFLANPDALPEIYALGLRNPWRITYRPGDGSLYVGDVGFNTWEELNLVQPGANYGWPLREGPCPQGQAQPCAPVPPQYTDPILYYQHPPGGGGALTGLAFYSGNVFPAAYQDAVFFTDFNQQFLASSSLANPPVTGFALLTSHAGFIADMEYHDGFLYLLDIYTNQILKLEYTDNPAPTAVLGADATLGAAPLPVVFSAAGSTVPPNTTATYVWDFGEGGSPSETASPAITHTYTVDGNYTASLTVKDSSGGISAPASLPITVYSGEMPVIALANLTEPGRSLFHGGDTWQYTATRSTLADLDPEAPFTWSIDLNHNQHAHPILTGNVTLSDTLDIPRDDHGGSVAISYTFRLTMLTADGIRVPASASLLPEVASLTLATDPQPTGAALITVNYALCGVPCVFPSIVGTEYTLTAAPHLFYQAGFYLFSQWDGGAPGDPVLVITTPPGGGTFTARYGFASPASVLWLPVIFRSPGILAPQP